ncbi:hypothetical protein DPEC_G00075320 [Dallia pectoralis]|uniref:Uncharacterized protein n=1 Tax=Dallia pectoralis TaxID=75939 RepID=A0ACC2H455_DALPE|nr:hypothetical protein DPEC_G00075320 [Dallia pectoralis]
MKALRRGELGTDLVYSMGNGLTPGQCYWISGKGRQIAWWFEQLNSNRKGTTIGREGEMTMESEMKSSPIAAAGSWAAESFI